MVNQGIKLRQMQINDLPALMEIKNDEHWNQTEDDWKFLINTFPKYCLVALDGEKVVGTVTSTNFNNQVGWIGMMLVRKPYRGLGISRRLMSAVIELLKDDCESIKLDATPAGEKVYKKLGFEKEYNVYRITNVEGIPSGSSSNTIHVKAINPDILDQLKSIDQQAFGSDRSALIDFLLTQKTNAHGYVGNQEHVEGYTLSRFGHNYTQIGPVIAESEKIAMELIEWAFTEIEGPLVIDIPVDKSTLVRWVESFGFKIQREFIRMYLKSNNYQGRTDQCYAIAGPEYG
ncbi:MAG: GNAT family N-acetyltransferase [Bacteroidota bacterium]